MERIRKIYQWIPKLETIDQKVAAQRTMLHIDRVFSFVQLFVPRRVSNEEIGDALELIAAHFERSPARWPAYVKMVTTVFWIIINSARYLAKRADTKKASSKD